MEHKTVTKIKTAKRRKQAVVALIAHDARKVDVVALASGHFEALKECRIVATGTTGKTIREKTGLDVQCLQSGPTGGDLQIGGLVASDEVDMVIFLRDPLTAQPHEPDISALMRVCDVHNVPLATNPATANLLLAELKRKLHYEGNEGSISAGGSC